MSHVKPTCRCGCGQLPGPRAVYVNGHNHMMHIRVVGMTWERALEIAVASLERTSLPPRKHRSPTAVIPTPAPNGRRLTSDEVARIWRLTRANWSVRQIAEDLDVSPRTVERVRANERRTA